MHILVTGGAGYIGSHVCKALSQKGYIPVTLDNLSLGHRSAVKWGPFVEGDILDAPLLNALCRTYPFKGAIHLAALSNVRESLQTPLSYYRNNVVGSLTLLETLQKQGIAYSVLSSTCAIYGLPKQTSIDEDHAKNPINIYGKSKWMVEQMGQSISQTYGMHFATLRYFNAAGADLEGEIGESHDPETHLIPLLIQTALKKRPHFTLFGSDHATPDGTPIRDFIHVTDLAEAHIKALEWMMENNKNLTLNLGTGKGYSVKEVIQAVEKELASSIPVVEGERLKEDPPFLVANPEKAFKLLNWKPKHSDLPTIIHTAKQWLKKK
ncbi:MAG: UDP-glucose 4-epimerase GalE [Simkaniaceae bacterium]